MKKIVFSLMCTFFSGMTFNIMTMISEKETITILDYLVKNIETAADYINTVQPVNPIDRPVNIALYMKPIISQPTIKQKILVIPQANINQFLVYAEPVIDLYNKEQKFNQEKIQLLTSACKELLLFSNQFPPQIANKLKNLYNHLAPTDFFDFSERNNDLEEEIEEYSEEDTPINTRNPKSKKCCCCLCIFAFFLSYLIYKLSCLKEQ